MSKKNNKEFFTTGEAAKMTGISRATIVNYCRDGRLECQKTPVTNFRRISKDQFLRFIEKHGIPVNFKKYGI
ncbi:MAG: helix-turn-helix domain-containing protein [Fibrobacterota bacterium]